MLFRSEGTASEDAVIEVLTLDEIMHRGFGDGAVDLCKMDVEGAEYEVLLGGSSASLRSVHYLVIEIHAAELTQQDSLLTKLSSIGFERIKTSSSCDDVHLFVNREWTDSSRS